VVGWESWGEWHVVVSLSVHRVVDVSLSDVEVDHPLRSLDGGVVVAGVEEDGAVVRFVGACGDEEWRAAGVVVGVDRGVRHVVVSYRLWQVHSQPAFWCHPNPQFTNNTEGFVLLDVDNDGTDEVMGFLR
jgi:hypothetical protein